MAVNVTFDTTEFVKNAEKLNTKLIGALMPAYRMVGDEIMRLSQKIVPHDTGQLQNSGSVQDGDEEVIVGYNKVYAARLHEHPEYRFQKRRQGKYLESPIRDNSMRLGKFLADELKRLL